MFNESIFKRAMQDCETETLVTMIGCYRAHPSKQNLQMIAICKEILTERIGNL